MALESVRFGRIEFVLSSPDVCLGTDDSVKQLNQSNCIESIELKSEHQKDR